MMFLAIQSSQGRVTRERKNAKKVRRENDGKLFYSTSPAAQATHP